MVYKAQLLTCFTCCIALVRGAETSRVEESSFAYEIANRTSTAHALTHDVKVVLSKDGHSASVGFAHAENQYEYQLSLVNVYSDDAKVIVYTDRGVEQRYAKSSRTFQSRIHGKWASVTLGEDGSVSGIFEDGHKVIELAPFNAIGLEAELLETSSSGNGPAHVVSERPLRDMSLGAGTHYRGSLLQEVSDGETKGQTLFPTAGPIVIDQDVLREDSTHTSIMATDGSMPRHEIARDIEAWFPGCYSGDASMHKVVLGVIADVPAFKRYGAGVKSVMEGIVNEASHIYEKQMNVRLVIGSTIIHESDSSAPDYAKTPKLCNSSKGMDTLVWMPPKMKQFSHAQKPGFEAAWSLFTGCDSGKWGIMGIARIASLCTRQGLNVAVNQLYIDSPWLTFAQELAHQFAGKHTFEEGQGKTGGLLDYAEDGNGKVIRKNNFKISGAYQFNSKYCKKQMCQHMATSVGNCEGKFDKASGGSPTPSPSTPTPSPTPSPRRRRRARRRARPTPRPTPGPKEPLPTRRRRLAEALRRRRRREGPGIIKEKHVKVT